MPYRRNRNFTGREEVLDSLYDALRSRQPAALTQAISGLGGVGKTQLALEYAYRYRADYDLIWWINSEEPTTLASDYALLAQKLDLPVKDAQEQKVIIQALYQHLSQIKDWLLVFDNAESKNQIYPYLPQGEGGHVVITSRNRDWRDVASPLTIRTWEPQESVTFLLARTGQNDAEGASQLADALGHLPLALEQAAAYIEESSTPFGTYLALLETRRKELWDEETPPLGYPDTVATTWSLSMDRLVQNEKARAGLEVMNFCAFLAPDDIPRSFLTTMPDHVPEERSTVFRDVLQINRGIKELSRYSLIEASPESLSVHRLVQAVVRDRLQEGAKMWAEAAIGVVTQAWPGDTLDYSAWPECERLLPHANVCIRQAETRRIETEEVALLANKIGIYLYGLAVYEEAEPLLRLALAIFQNVLGENHPETASSYNNLAELYRSQGRYEEAEPLYQKALAIEQNVLGENHRSTATSYNNLALLYDSQGRYEEAEPLYQKALAIRENVLGENHPETASSYNNLALLYDSQGRYEEAEPLYQKALAIRENVLGENHPDTASSYNNLALLYYSQGRYEEAEPLLRLALAIRENVLGENHPDTAQSYNNLAELYRSQGRYEEAEPLLRLALAIRENVLGENHPATAGSYNNLAALYGSQGRYEEAEPLYQKALAIVENVLGENHPNTAGSYNNLAALYGSQGRYEEAEPLYQKALAIVENVLGENHPYTITARGNLQRLLARIGKQKG